jgi:hypothetical protein
MLAATMRRVVTSFMFLPLALSLPLNVIRVVQAATRSLSRGDRLQVQPAATIALAWRRGIARPCGRLEFSGMNASVKAAALLIAGSAGRAGEVQATETTGLLRPHLSRS